MLPLLQDFVWKQHLCCFKTSIKIL